MKALTVPDFKKTLSKMVDCGDLSLPSTVDPSAFRNAAIIAAQTNPAILKCEPASVFTAIRHLAGMGLVPDNREAALVPFKNKAQAQPMVYGLIKAVKQSGQVVSLFADVVYEGELINSWIENGERKFDHTLEDGSRLNPMLRGGGSVIGAYAVAKLKDGTIEFEPMSHHEIEKRRMASPNQRDARNPSGIWESWYEEMAKKTVIRAICKRLPMSSEDHMRIIDKDPTFQEVPIKDVTPPETTEERLKRLSRERRDATPVTGEIMPDDLEFDEGAADGQSPEFESGATAYGAGLGEENNPHSENPMYSSWLLGYRRAESAAS